MQVMWPWIYSLFQQMKYTKKTHGREKVLTLQKTLGVLTKNQNTNPRKILGVFTKFHEIWMSY